MIYVYYSAPYDLKESFVTPEYFEARRRDKNCAKIFENSTTGELVILNPKPLRLKADDITNRHSHLMIRLSEILKKGNILVLGDITDLSEKADEADCLYQRFIDKGICMEFLNSPWLNSDNLRLLLMSDPYETKKAVSLALTSTIKWKSSRISDTSCIDPKITQQSDAVKKNGF